MLLYHRTTLERARWVEALGFAEASGITGPALERAGAWFTDCPTPTATLDDKGVLITVEFPNEDTLSLDRFRVGGPLVRGGVGDYVIPMRFVDVRARIVDVAALEPRRAAA